MQEPLILDANDPRWLNLIEQDPAATIFHHPAWMKMLSASYGYRPFIFATPDGDSQLGAGIPFAEVNDHLTPRRWVALPFSDYCMPLSRVGEEGLCGLAQGLVEKYQAKKCPRVEVRAAFPKNSQLQAEAPYVLHMVPLEADSGRVAKRVHRTQMQNVRTAEKNGIRVVRGTGIDEVRAFYHLHCLNRRKHGVPAQPWNFFKLLTRNILEQGLGFVLLAYKEDICISGGVFLHWQKTLTYKYSATDENNQNLRPNHLVTWTAMQWGCEQGCTVFDFGRADPEDQGLRDYKRRWGATEDQLSYSYFPSAPPIKGTGKFEKLLQTVIRNTPLWVCRAAGEVLYRYAG